LTRDYGGTTKRRTFGFVPTVTDRHDSVCSGSDDSIGQSDSDDNLEANSFGQELADLDSDEHREWAEERLQAAEREFRDRSTESLADYEGRYNDEVAAMWDTPRGEWW